MPRLQHCSSHLANMLVIPPTDELCLFINHNACHRSYHIKNDTMRPLFCIPHIKVLVEYMSLLLSPVATHLPMKAWKRYCPWKLLFAVIDLIQNLTQKNPYQATVHSLRWTSSSQKTINHKMLAQMTSIWTLYGSLTYNNQCAITSNQEKDWFFYQTLPSVLVIRFL
jgi:hypothetical protein